MVTLSLKYYHYAITILLMQTKGEPIACYIDIIGFWVWFCASLALKVHSYGFPFFQVTREQSPHRGDLQINAQLD